MTVPNSAIHMVRIDIDLKSFHRWAGSRQLIGRSFFDEGFAMHCLLMETFGGISPKPFRLLAPHQIGVSRSVLYGYAQVSAGRLIDSAGSFADPLQMLVLPKESIRTKAMPSDWESGRRLGFEVLVRPVVRQTRNAKHPGAERDAYQREAEQVPEGRMLPGREDVYVQWLSDRLARQGGAKLEECRLAAFRRVRVVRKLHGPSIDGPSAVMHGTLTISEGRKFSELLRSGIGRHRSYGYGMLLLRPPHTRG